MDPVMKEQNFVSFETKLFFISAKEWLDNKYASWIVHKRPWENEVNQFSVKKSRGKALRRMD